MHSALFLQALVALVAFSDHVLAYDPKITTLLRDGSIVNAETIDLEMELSHVPKAGGIRSCVCRTTTLLEGKDDWRLDSRDAGLFPGEEEECMPVHLADDVSALAEEDSNEVVTAQTSWRVSRKGEGWHAISLRLYVVDAGDDDEEGVNACEDGRRRLTSYSQSVIFVGGGAPEPDKKSKEFDWGNCHINFKKVEDKTECLEDAYYSDSFSNSPPFLGISFPVGGGFGWGTVGLELTRWMIGNGDGFEKPLFLEEVHGGIVSPEDRESIQDWLVWSSEMRSVGIPSMRNRTQWLVKPTDPMTAEGGEKAECKVVTYPVVHALGKYGDEDVDTYNLLFDNATWERTVPTVSRNNIGIIFSESTSWSQKDIQKLRYFNTLYAGSTWNAEVIRNASKALFPDYPLEVGVFYQGVNKDIWGSEEACSAEKDEGEFIVFSGGKLELRKGQDLVIAAFKVFAQAHPEAKLMVAWQNDWPQTLATISNSSHVQGGAPKLDTNTGTLNLVDWLEENGIDRDRVIDLGRLDQAEMAVELAKADVALFPNRCEGGTNLVAMEALASGVPTILSDNTGHKDLVRRVCKEKAQSKKKNKKNKKKVKEELKGDGCYGLTTQAEVPGHHGWGESSIEEIVEALEKVHADRAAAQEVAKVGKSRIWTWKSEFNRIFKKVRKQYTSPPNRG